MKLRVIKGQRLGRMFDLVETSNIGCEPDNQIVVEDLGTSRYHARLVPHSDGGWMIEDLNSTNGVRLNGTRIGLCHSIKPGDRIGIGESILLATDDYGNVPGSFMAAEEAARIERGKLFSPVLILLLVLLAGLMLFWLKTIEPPDPATARTGTVETDSAAFEDEGESDEGQSAELSEVLESSPDRTAMVRAGPFGRPILVTAGLPETAPVDGDPKPGFERVEQTYGYSVDILSQPPGARVSIDRQYLGDTPLRVVQLSAGQHLLELEHKGYERLSRRFFLPLREALPEYQLELAPNRLKITSRPTGATVIYGSRILGRTPLLVDQLPAGKYQLDLLAHGYESRQVEAIISPLRGHQLQVDLAKVTAELNLVTVPAGCRVYLNDTYLGTTSQSVDGLVNRSRVLTVTDLLPGRHRIRISHPNAPDGVEQTIELPRGKTVNLPLGMWVPERIITLNDGRQKKGMIVARNQAGDLTLAESPTRTVTILKEQIVDDLPIEPQQAMAIRQNTVDPPRLAPDIRQQADANDHFNGFNHSIDWW